MTDELESERKPIRPNWPAVATILLCPLVTIFIGLLFHWSVMFIIVLYFYLGGVISWGEDLINAIRGKE